MLDAQVASVKAGKLLKVGRSRQSILPADGDPRTGGVWDILALGMLPLGVINSALFLGVGGGTVPRLVRWLHETSDEYTTGPIQFFGVDYEQVIKTAQAYMDLDAIGWENIYPHGLRMYIEENPPNRTFDLVVEDIFDEYKKPVMLRKEMYLEAMKLTGVAGLYAGNILPEYVRWYRPMVRSRFANVVQIECEGIENVVVMGSNLSWLTATFMRERIAEDGRFDTLLKKLSFRTIQDGRAKR